MSAKLTESSKDLQKTWNIRKGPLTLECPGCHAVDPGIYMSRSEFYEYTTAFYKVGEELYASKVADNNILQIDWSNGELINGGDDFSFQCSHCGEELNEYLYELEENDRLEIHDGLLSTRSSSSTRTANHTQRCPPKQMNSKPCSSGNSA